MTPQRERPVADFFTADERRPTTPMQALMEAAPGTEVQVSSIELPDDEASAVKAALDTLSKDERDMVLMHVAGISVREIADMIGVPKTTVHRKLPRLMERVAQEARRVHSRTDEGTSEGGSGEPSSQA